MQQMNWWIESVGWGTTVYVQNIIHLYAAAPCLALIALSVCPFTFPPSLPISLPSLGVYVWILCKQRTRLRRNATADPMQRKRHKNIWAARRRHNTIQVERNAKRTHISMQFAIRFNFDSELNCEITETKTPKHTKMRNFMFSHHIVGFVDYCQTIREKIGILQLFFQESLEALSKI